MDPGLRQRADRLSITTLSKVENDRISLSYDKLVRLSEGLEIDIEELFAPPGQNGGQAVVSGRRSINPAGGGALVATRNYDYRYLSTDLVHKKFIPIETDIRARTLEEFGPLVKHTGEEFVLRARRARSKCTRSCTRLSS